ncbi:MAG: putative biofilm formation methyltransferase WspC [candidate division WS2 bacterium]|nr:putative biofilm formation methyltransferase WspC [Candidatus Lithacetigena glycinireducens]
MTYDRKDFMTEDEFGLLKNLINKEFGILLKGDKRLTLHAKVSHRLKILGLKSYRDYYDFIVSDTTKDELFTLASHITNNETYFFREKTQLDAFSEILKDIKREKQKKNLKELKILSLGCSSGEEPYTLNIIIQESGLFLWDWDVRIIGVDLDKNAIKRARLGRYGKNSFRLNGNADSGTNNFLNKYFTSDGNHYILRKSLTNNVEFRFGNLLDNGFLSDINEVDVILCRNVLIYMDDTAINKIACNLYNCLTDSGYLFVGSAESLIQRTDLFVAEYNNGIIVYRKSPHPPFTKRG